MIDTLVLPDTVPPVPVHEILYVVFDVGLTVAVPDVDLLPVNVPPLAVHDVTLALDHVSVTGLPLVTDVGETERETEGALGFKPFTFLKAS